MQRIVKYLVSAGALAAALAAPVLARGATSTARMTVTATVPVVCTVDGGTLEFAYGAGTTFTQSQSNLLVNCPVGVPFSVDLDAGAHPGGSGAYQYRQMSDGGTGTITYYLYKDAAYSQYFGSTTYGSPVTGTGSQWISVYAQAYWASAGPGTYTDAVTATVTF